MHPNSGSPVNGAKNGAILVGTGDRCGKTVAVTGLAAVLQESGFRVQAVKPLNLQPAATLVPGRDQAYMTQVTNQFLQFNAIEAPSAWAVTAMDWNRMASQCRELPYPVLIEAPGQAATPWRMTGQRAYDAVDFAVEMNLALIIVGAAGPGFAAGIRSADAFLRARDACANGFLRVYTDSEEAQPDLAVTEAMALSQWTHMPFLGDIPYSPSISVMTAQQGNLLRTVSENIDLLPLQMALGFML